MIKKIFHLTLLTCLLSSCASTTRYRPPSSYHITQLPKPAVTYLKKAQTSTGSTQVEESLLAATRLLQDGSVNTASQQLEKIKILSLSSQQMLHLNILHAYLALELDQTKSARTYLGRVNNPQQLNSALRLLYFQVANIAYQRSDRIVASLMAQLNILRLKSTTNMLELTKIWQELQTLPIKTLQQVMTNSSDTKINAWLQLTILAKQYNSKPTQLVNAIKQWQQQHPKHVANLLIPDTNRLTQAAASSTPSQIALLLPLKGKFNSMAQAIRNGFLAAYYQHIKTSAKVPSIKVYDTSQKNILTVYQQAVENGAQLIIGPLTKQHVKTLINADNVSVPTITLNYSSTPTNIRNLVEFGLSPKQAAKQIAQKAWQYGSSKILIIAPKSNWGTMTANAFRATWLQLGGQVMGDLAFTKNNLQQQIASLLQIKKSEAREMALQRAVGKSLVFTPRRRFDINGIFLIASPAVARQIKPLLKFYFAGNLPIFSSSLVYNGYPQLDRNRDLNGIYFSDIPLILNPDLQSIRQQVRRAWPQNYREYNRLYGLGMDAFTLSLEFNRLLALPNFAVQGVTGDLSLQGQQIHRQLSWAKFIKGRAVEIGK